MTEWVIELNLNEVWPLLNVVGEICYGFDVDFETVIGVKSEVVIDLMQEISKKNKETIEKGMNVVTLILSDLELDVLKRCIDEVIREIEEWEFQTRIGVFISDIIAIKEKLLKT